MTPEQKQAYDLKKAGKTRSEIASIMGLSFRQVKSRLSAARRWVDANHALSDAADAGGLDDPASLSHFWKIVKDENGNGHSLFIKNNEGTDTSFSEMILDAIEDIKEDAQLDFEPRSINNTGDHLLVIDLADVHFGKLAVKTETGFEYNRQVARHRVIEGTKALLRMSCGFNIGRILFVLGNDILHVDDSYNKTTSGTHQDTDGSIFQMWSDAFSAMSDAIKECASVADVDLIHCMSNHDWKMGWTLSQAIGARFEDWPTVIASTYNLSEIHTKLYAYENNLFLITHGDGAKEEKLYSVFANEGREFVGKCQNKYALLHHFHHKISKKRGKDVFVSEKDHEGMTAIISGSHNVQGGHINIEYVRSPSAPDGWHHRNRYINRQGVECFVFHPYDGMKARFTEWF